MFNDYNEKFLNDSYLEACNDDNFIKLIKSLKINNDVAKKYTSKLEETVNELNNCKSCKGLALCPNKTSGHVDYPQVWDDRLRFINVPCKKLKDLEKKHNSKTEITMSDIHTDEKSRVPVIKWMTKFLSDLDTGKANKGLYLHGNFGCGKTFLLSALFNELSKRRVSTLVIYFPELLRDLKSDFDSFGDKMEHLKRVDYLLIDDIGAEKVTDWGRDEILGTILQYRMSNNKITFFTSNLSVKSLEDHLAVSKLEVDKVKANRIIERIKFLSDEIELIGTNRR